MRVPRVFRQLVRRNVGLLPPFDMWLKARRAHETLRLKSVEDEAVRFVGRQWGDRPRAEIVTVIPTYKRPQALRRAVESALAQTVHGHVVVVIDDGGGITDDLPADHRLFVVSLPTNTGTVGVVRNVGIRATDSRYLAFLDDDNEWRPDHLAVALHRHAEGAQLTYSGLERVDDRGRPLDVLAVPFDRRAMREQGFVDASAIVVDRGRRVRFSRTPRRFGDFPREDWEFVWRLSRSMRTELVPDVTARYVVHDGSLYTDWRQAASSPPADGGPSNDPDLG